MSVKMRKGKTENSLNWHEIWHELNSADDRAAALIGEAILEQNLTTILNRYFVMNQDEANLLLTDRGLLSGVYKKSLLAYCLGLITHEQLEEIRAINKIRNYFAHGLHIASFNDKSIKDMNVRIKPYERFLTPEFIGSNRLLFIVTVSILAYVLSIESTKVEHRQEKRPQTTLEELRNKFPDLSL